MPHSSKIPAGVCGALVLLISLTIQAQVPGTPVLTSPTNGATGRSTTALTLNWATLTGASSYTVQVSQSSVFSTTVLTSSMSSSSLPVPGLVINTSYFWRVDATGSGGTGPWSGAWSFTTVNVVPASPTLTLPTNGAPNQAIAINLSWGELASASTYGVQVSTVSTFYSLFLTRTGITAISSLDTFLNATTYYWEVNATNPIGTSIWSSIWSFTTGPMTAAPTLAAPSNGAIDQALSLTLSWNSVSTATSYAVEVSATSAFSPTISKQTGITGKSLAVTGLANSMNYYWRVNASGPYGTSNWSSVYSFATPLTAPAAPALTSPSNSATGISNHPVFAWQTVNTSTYTLQVSSISAFSTTIVSQSGLGASDSIEATLAFNTTWYWRVDATNSLGTSAWSSAWSFVTETEIPVPAAPALSSPGYGSVYTNGASTVSLVWGAVSGAATYSVLVSTGSAFANTVFYQNGAATSATYNYGAGKTGDRYWRVNATNSSGTGAWSAAWYFDIEPAVTPIFPAMENAGPSDIAGFVHGTIAYKLKEQSLVDVSLFDILGRKIFSFNRMESSGSYSLSLKNYDFPAGIYLLQIKAGAMERRMRIVLPGG
jgi:hypothetical protein